MTSVHLFSGQASAAATTVESAVAQERHAGTRKAAALIVEGRPGRALYELARSVQRQARYAGITAEVAPVCPCGGRCDTDV